MVLGRARALKPLKPPSAYRPWWMRALSSGFEHAWAAGVLTDPDLQEATLFAMARRTAGLDDFGDLDFLPAMRVYLASARAEARPNPFGRVIAQGSALKVLRERAWAQRLFNAHPEIAARPLAPPVIIVGPMRSGTTRLHRLLACDPHFAHLKLFEATCPVPWPRSRRGALDDPRARYVARGLAMLNAVNRANAIIHPTGAWQPDEELGLLEASFWGAMLEAQRPIPAYARWSETADAGPAYRHMARLLRLIGWWRGEHPSKPWLLKTPQHMGHLPALLAALPGARLIVTARDPATVVASSASLAWNQMLIQTDHLDPAWVGREWLHKSAWRAAALARDRAALQADSIDVPFSEVETDAMGAVARIYRWLDRPLAPEVADAMRAYLARAAPRRRTHRYRLEDFGLDHAMVQARFAGI